MHPRRPTPVSPAGAVLDQRADPGLTSHTTVSHDGTKQLAVSRRVQSRIFQRTALLTCTFATHGCTALSRSQCATTWTERHAGRRPSPQVTAHFLCAIRTPVRSTALLSTVATTLDDDLVISSAGLLRGGAIAWVDVSVPETITTPVGFDFRPNLLATTSFDGSIATTFKRTVTATVCDNTRDLALAETGQNYRGQTHPLLRRQDHRRTGSPRRVHTLSDASPRSWTSSPTPRSGNPSGEPSSTPTCPSTTARATPWKAAPDAGDAKAGRAGEPLPHDGRAAPWTGTALGVIQATNTWAHHYAASEGPAAPSATCFRPSPEQPPLPIEPWLPLCLGCWPPDQPMPPPWPIAAEGPRRLVAQAQQGGLRPTPHLRQANAFGRSPEASERGVPGWFTRHRWKAHQPDMAPFCVKTPWAGWS